MGFDKYSVIGWSEGSKVALLMATIYSQSIESIVLTSVSTHVSNECLKTILSTKSVQSWSKDKLECYLRSYDNVDDIQQLWNKYVKFIEYYNQYFPLIKNNYHLIECPVLVIHGDKVCHNDSSMI